MMHLTLPSTLTGEAHPDLAAPLDNLAVLYRGTGRYTEAEPLYRRALVIWEKILPADHRDLMVGLENYAGLLEALDRPAEAAELRARAEAIRHRRG